MVSGMRRTILLSSFVVVLILSAAKVSTAQDVLSQARSLYEAAAYEDALQLLDHYVGDAALDEKHGTRTPALDEYRALCLLALNRPDDAETVLHRLISLDPLYTPSSKDPAPRFRSAVLKIRNQVIPPTAHRLYEEAYAAAGRRRYNEAIVALEQLFRIVEQPGLDEDAAGSLTDVVRAAKELLDISRRSQTVYAARDPGVTPAIAVKQMLPDPSLLKQRIRNAQSAELELVIDAKGVVESATLSAPIHPDYDALLLQAARTWRYQPAQQNGRPVPWRTVMTIQLTPVSGN